MESDKGRQAGMDERGNPGNPGRKGGAAAGDAMRGGARRAGLPACAGLALLAAIAGCDSSNSPGKEEPRDELLALRITEIHYHPADEGDVAGDDLEFIEIKNTGSSTLDLTGVGFNDGIEYEFPSGTTLEAGKFIVLAAIAPRFAAQYGFQPFDVFNGKLNNAGEKVVLADLKSGGVIDAVTYADGGEWPAIADGGGHSLVPVSLSDRSKGWRASFRVDGSPGKDDVIAAVINEISTHTDPPASDAIELHNPEDIEMDVGGWYLSDDREEPAKFRIPAGTKIPAGGYVVFDESDFNADTTLPTSFTLNSHGEEVWLSADSLGCRGAYCHGFEFGESENGATFGRYVDRDGKEHFPTQRLSTLGKANAGPLMDPVVISEVMYHAVNDTDEFVEIANTGDDSVPLFDPDRPANTWKVEGISFKFPEGVTLAAGEVVLVVPVRTTPERVRSVYLVPDSVRIFKAGGELSNSTDTLALMKPAEPYLKNGAAPGDSTVPYLKLDEVTYLDAGSWPSSADGEGHSLQRKDRKTYGNDPANWTAGPPNAGK